MASGDKHREKLGWPPRSTFSRNAMFLFWKLPERCFLIPGEAGIALTMRSRISMFLYYYSLSITKITLAKSKKHAAEPLSPPKRCGIASTSPWSIQENPAQIFRIIFGSWSSGSKIAIWDNRLNNDCMRSSHSRPHIGVLPSLRSLQTSRNSK